MSFLYPLGLLGLIGMPILILIYIIKNKHTEQIVPTTYIWTLSEKFLKKKRRINPLSGIISLILQLLIVITVSLIIAHPVITIKGSAKEYCFIVDASGSMNMIYDDKTRMERGKEEIEDIILSSKEGSRYTLLYVDDSTKIVYENLKDKNKAIELLDKVKISGVTEDYTDAITFVQKKFNINKSLVTYLITDKDYTSSNIQIINVAENEKNYAITSSDYSVNDGKLVVTGSVISYENNEKIQLEVLINQEVKSTIDIDTQKLVETNFEATIEQTEFNEIEIRIKNQDGLMIDNKQIIYNMEKENAYKTLIISDQPFYLQSVLEVVTNTTCYVISPTNYHASMNGYDLYIFDNFAPEVLPSDGTVWLFGADKSIEGAGFSVRDIVENEAGSKLTYPRNSTKLFTLLTKGLAKDEIYVTKYIKYGLHRNFTTILTNDGNPIVFTGVSDFGNREVVFAFDLHNSNLPLMVDFLIFTKNLIDYSFPVVFESDDYVSGDLVEINVLSNCNSIRVESPQGNISYLDVSNETTELKLKEAGVYNLTMLFGENEKTYKIYAALPSEESTNEHALEDFSLKGELQNEFIDGVYNKLIILFILLLIIYIADWGGYCYEQYQLR